MPEPRPFLDLFMHAAGTSEVPRHYFEWSALSVIAACLNDRVYYTKHKKPVYPNLYITLVGPSGDGKDIASDFASDLVKKSKAVYRYYGKVSGAGLADVLTRPEAKKPSISGRPTVWLVFPELSNSIGKAQQADDFVKRLTALSKGQDDRYQEATRALVQEGADLDYQVPLINAFFGSTAQWLLQAVTGESITSGFFGRMLVVTASINASLRVTDPTYPDDYDQAIDELKERLHKVSRLSGEFLFTDKAWSIRDQWYQNRPGWEDDRLRPSWRRQDDHAIKLAMCLSAVERSDLLITSPIYLQAQRYMFFAHKCLAGLLGYAAREKQTGGLETVADLIRQAERIPHSALLKKVNHHGIHAPEMKLHVGALVERGDVKQHMNGVGRVYEWVGG